MKKQYKLLMVALLLVFGCSKEDQMPEINLNGIYEGTYSGWVQPQSGNGNATWTIVHKQDSVTATINLNYPKTFKGIIINDSTIIGGFEILKGVPVSQSIVEGKIIDSGNKLSFNTSRNDPAYNYVRFNFLLSKK